MLKLICTLFYCGTKDSRQLKDVDINLFRFLHGKIYPDLSLELEKTLKSVWAIYFIIFEKPIIFCYCALFLQTL
jgi:hypothetical protein